VLAPTDPLSKAAEMAWMAWTEAIPFNYLNILREHRLPLLISAIAVFCFGLWKVSETIGAWQVSKFNEM